MRSFASILVFGWRKMIKPNYVLPIGKEIVTATQTIRLRRAKDNCFEAIDVHTGEAIIYSHQEALELLRRPDVTLPLIHSPDSEATAKIRTGGLFHRDQLSLRQQDELDFRKAFCVSVDALEATGIELKNVNLDKSKNRKFVRNFASKIYTAVPIAIDQVRGGKAKAIAVLPKGRTLLKYVNRYRNSGQNEMALADQDWLKGNRTPRFPLRVEELISQAIDEVALDTKGPPISQVLSRHEQLIETENERRKSLGLALLKAATFKPISERFKAISSTARDIARKGKKHVANNRSRGSTDTRALMIGDFVEIDECKISLMATVKERGLWQTLSKEEQITLAEIDNLIQTRLWLVVVLDVATRMPLGWALSDGPSTEATLAAVRMATREKTREKVLYGCKRDPMPIVGLLQLRSDNGTGVRNANTKTAFLGLNAQSVDMRAYHGVEKPHLERMFGSIESILFQLIHGYTGRRAGALPGYDPIKNGVLDCAEIYGLITRYFVDEYPYRRHYGVGMMGARPIKVYERVNNIYGCVDPTPSLDRRIALGWKSKATVTDDGVKAFGLHYTSTDLQLLRDKIKTKVTIYSDPDLVDEVTILVEGHPKPILGRLSWTAMKGLTIPELLKFVASIRAETPKETIDFESQRIRSARTRFEHMRLTAIEHKLPRSFMTQAEAETKAKVVMTGVHAPVEPTPNTAKPGSIGSPDPIAGVRKVGKGFCPEANANQDTGVRPKTERPKKPDTKGKLS